MKRPSLRVAFAAFVLALAAVATAACSTPSSAGKPEKPPVPPMEEAHAKPANDLFMPDVKTAVAAQLECPLEEINLTCVKRDQQGECVAVRGDGCEKTVEYQFGDPG